MWIQIHYGLRFNPSQRTQIFGCQKRIHHIQNIV